MKKIKSFIVIFVIAGLMLAGCSNIQRPDDINNNDLPKEKVSRDETDLNEEDTNSAQNIEVAGKVFYGKVKSIIGNEIEIEIGTVPDWDGGNGDEGITPEDKKKPGVSTVKVKEKENPEGMEDYYAPDPNSSIFGESGEINLNYTGESRTLIIPAGTDIRDTLGKKAVLDSIKKGAILMIKPKVIDGEDSGIEMLTILGWGDRYEEKRYWK